MLKSFTIKNLNSIKNEVIFSMERDSDLNENLQSVIKLNNGEELLKVASIYGPNGGGKTNLLKGLIFIKELVNGKIINDDEIGIRSYSSFSTFKFGEELSELIEGEIVVTNGEYNMFYSFIVEYKDESIKFINEFFGVGNENYSDIFVRDGSKITSDLIDELSLNNMKINDQMPFIHFLYRNIDEKVNAIGIEYIKNFYDIIKKINFLSNKRLMKSMYVTNGFKYKLEDDVKKFVINSLNKLDINITNIIVKEENDRIKILCTHGHEKKLLDYNFESHGTRVLINMLIQIYNYMKVGSIIIIDEIDSALHPKLVNALVKMFNSNENKRVQLIYTSHDIWNMTPENFRRDQIWFAFKNKINSTEILCLADFIDKDGKRTRKDAKYSKQYMESRYGADPFISKALLWDSDLFE